MDYAQIILGLCVGVGLAAACGFRVFVPLLVVSLASHAGWITLAHNMDWLGSTPSLIAFSIATACEVGAYYVPWIDNMLDTIATPAAVIAGIVASAAVFVDMDPLLQWSIAIIAGGALAGGVQSMSVVTRSASTASTGGAANHVVSTVEAGASTGVSLLAIFLAPAAAVLVLGGAAAMIIYVMRRRRRQAQALPLSVGIMATP